MPIKWWLVVGLIGFLGYLPGLPRPLILLNLFFLYPWVRGLIRWLRQPKPSAPSVPRLDYPLPPVAGGAWLFTLRAVLAQGVMMVTPLDAAPGSTADRRGRDRPPACAGVSGGLSAALPLSFTL
jgi:hypothetical protein